MIDIGQIRNDPELFERTAKWKGIELSVKQLLETDDMRRQLMREVEPLRALRNRLSEEIPGMLRQGRKEEADNRRKEAAAVKEKLAELEPQLQAVERRFERLMLLVPNPVSSDTPIGASDKDNVELKKAGKLPEFNFQPKDHITLGTALRLLDLERGVKIAGTRNYVLTGMGLHLHRAVQQLAIDFLHERTFTVMDVPLMVGKETLVNSGFFPSGEEQTYAVDGENKWLVGTSEASLIAYYSNEVVNVSEPIRLAAVSNCFRKEAGSDGRDVQGLYRVHQFAKVEQVVLCKANPAVAESMHAEITRNAEELLQLLELPYRVVAVCTGDMSQKNHKQYDIEAWMPSRGSYGETHSSSSLLDFQARRSNIRYRDDNGALRYCYTLNNTAIASPRILIPLLEIHQQADGSVRIPKALQKYMMGAEVIS